MFFCLGELVPNTRRVFIPKGLTERVCSQPMIQMSFNNFVRFEPGKISVPHWQSDNKILFYPATSPLIMSRRATPDRIRIDCDKVRIFPRADWSIEINIKSECTFIRITFHRFEDKRESGIHSFSFLFSTPFIQRNLRRLANALRMLLLADGTHSILSFNLPNWDFLMP